MTKQVLLVVGFLLAIGVAATLIAGPAKSQKLGGKAHRGSHRFQRPSEQTLNLLELGLCFRRGARRDHDGIVPRPRNSIMGAGAPRQSHAGYGVRPAQAVIVLGRSRFGASGLTGTA